MDSETARRADARDAPNRFRQGTAFKVTDRGPLFLDFELHRVTALRPSPARAWVTARNDGARWFGSRDPGIDVSSLIREVREHVPSGAAPLGRFANGPANAAHESDVRPVVYWR